MAVTAVKEYAFSARDRLENFHGRQLLYVGWDEHLMFCAPFAFPFPPDMPFRALIEQVLPGAFGYHPDFARIDWATAEWWKAGEPWRPDLDKSLADNGLVHKDLLRLRTPGLRGIADCCS